MVRITRWEFVHLAGLNLFRAQFRWLAGVQTYVLLQNKCVREFLVAHGTLMQYPERRFRPVYAHMSFQVALSGKCSTANLALERTFTGVGPVVHL